MGEVSSAVEAILAGVSALQSASVEELTHREIVAEMSRLTTVAWMLPSVEHRLIQRLTAETEPCRLGESSWKKVLTTALRVSGKDATRRLDQAAALGPRRAMTGEPLAPRWEATATAQARGALGAEQVAIIAKFHNQLPGWVDVGTREVADAQLADLAAGWGPEALDKAVAALLMMIDQDGPEPSEKEPARHRSVTMGPQQRDGTRSIRGRLDAQAGAYWEAILAKEAAPGVNNPDDQSGGADNQSGADGGPRRAGPHRYPHPGPTQPRRLHSGRAPGPGPRGPRHPQRATGDGDRVGHPAGPGKRCRAGGHRGWLIHPDPDADPDGRPGRPPLPVHLRPTHP